MITLFQVHRVQQVKLDTSELTIQRKTLVDVVTTDVLSSTAQLLVLHVLQEFVLLRMMTIAHLEMLSSLMLRQYSMRLRRVIQ